MLDAPPLTTAATPTPLAAVALEMSLPQTEISETTAPAALKLTAFSVLSKRNTLSQIEMALELERRTVAAAVLEVLLPTKIFPVTVNCCARLRYTAEFTLPSNLLPDRVTLKTGTEFTTSV